MATADDRQPGLLDRVGDGVGRAVAPAGERVIEEIDINALLDRVDVDHLLDRVDVDRLLDRVDVAALVQRAEIGEVIAEQAGEISRALNIFRRQLVAVDEIVTATLRRVLGRQQHGEDREGADPESVDGRPAGLLSRLVGLALDLILAGLVVTVLAASFVFVVGVVGGVSLPSGAGPLMALLGSGAFITFALSVVSIGTIGRSPGMAIVGTRVLDVEGGPPTPRQAFVRTGVQSLLTPVFGLTYVGVLLSGKRRTVHDRASGTELVYDWGGQRASMSSPLGSFLADHGVDPGA